MNILEGDRLEDELITWNRVWKGKRMPPLTGVGVSHFDEIERVHNGMLLEENEFAVQLSQSYCLDRLTAMPANPPASMFAPRE